MQERETNWEFQISQYLDGLLDGPALAELQARLEEDPRLRDTLRQYQLLQEQLDALGREDLAIDFDAQRAEIMAGVRRRQTRGSWRARAARPVLVALSVAAAVVVAWGVVTIARWTLPGQASRVESVALRPAALQQGQVVASVVGPLADDVRGVVSVLARRMQAPPSSPAKSSPAGLVVVSIGATEQAEENKTKEAQALPTNDTDTYWF